MDVDDRWHKVIKDPVTGERRKVRTARYGTGKRWMARWRDAAGRQRGKSYDRKSDAEALLAKLASEAARGVDIDPHAGKVRLRDYAAGWLAGQTGEQTTRESTQMRVRLHILSALGDHEIRSLRPSTIQRWLAGLSAELAPNSVRVIYTNLNSILGAAVDDGVIGVNPCRASSVRPPAPDRRRIVPWTVERVAAVREQMPPRWTQMVTVGAGLGLRQGEILGLSPEDVDWLRAVVHIRRQVRLVGTRLVFAPPKGGKERDVPLSESVTFGLSSHLQAWPARSVTLPWKIQTGRLVTVPLFFTTRQTTAVGRNYLNARVWKVALAAAGVPGSRENGMHALRHFFASVALDGGASIKEVAEWLGHHDPGFTLRTYTHLMPRGAERLRSAIDAALSGESESEPDVEHGQR